MTMRRKAVGTDPDKPPLPVSPPPQLQASDDNALPTPPTVSPGHPDYDVQLRE
ncbi:hypothetical protein [Saccharopolyspora aridisoli]|uniref:hypothetical protein n=1 Tax=Saccharopolyspora aridisoli TaxID=2530385 RepID=UPI001404A1C2|nr:hypothetical protein [Saccharopolyspora aridisoli]